MKYPTLRGILICAIFEELSENQLNKPITMNIEQLREYCISKPGVTESFPFNDTALVFKVMDKMFALLDLSEEARGISLKCDPELAIELRGRYTEVTPAYHFNKVHWNGVSISGSVPDAQIYQWVEHSYKLVVSSLTRKKQEELSKL